MSFSSIQITSKGRALLARAQTGTVINFSRIKMGDGSMSGQAIDEMTDVISQKADLNINSLKVLTGGKAKVSATFTNQGLSTGFYWRELAVFATDPDNPSVDIMYCYGNAGALADYIPAEGSQILERVISVLTIISNAANVTATIDSSNVYVTVQDAEATYLKKSLATAASQFLISSAAGQWVVKTIGEIKTMLGLGSAAYTDSTAYATAAQGTKADNAATQTALNTHLSDYVRQPGYTVTTGSANAYSAALNPAPTAYADGMGIVIKINAANTGASTINVNGLGAKAVVDGKGNALTSGKLRLNGTYSLKYNSTSGNFILQGSDSSGNATPADLLAGKTASVDAGDIIGTMPNYAGTLQSPYNIESPGGGQILVHPKPGYYDSAGNVALYDANFIPANIMSGKSIFGLAGSLTSKKWKMALVISSDSPSTFRSVADGASNHYSVSVSLDFKPSFILLRIAPASNYENCTLYEDLGSGVIGTLYQRSAKLFGVSITQFNDLTFNIKGDVFPASVTSSGFTLPVMSGNATYCYIAIE